MNNTTELQKAHEYLDQASIDTLSALPVPLIVYCPINEKGRKIILVSDGFCRLLGYDRETFIEMYIQHRNSFIHPSDIRRLSAWETFAFMNPDKEINGVARLITANGDYKWISGQARRQKGPFGHELYYLSCSDVTDHLSYCNVNNQSVHHMDSLLKKILDTTKSAIFWKDTNRRYLGVNQAVVDHCGLSADKIIGRTNEEIGLTYIDCGKDKESDERILAGEPQIRSHVTICTQGKAKDIIITKTPLTHEGKIIGIVASFDDVTVENSLIRQIQQLNSILDNISVGVCLYHQHDNQFDCVATNSTLRELLNITSDDFYLHDGDDILMQLVYPADKWQIEYCIRKIAEGKQKISCNCRIYPKGSDQYIWMHLSADCVCKENTSFVYITFTDITAEKNAELALQYSQKAYETAADGAGLAIWRYDIVTDTKIFLDNRVSQLVRAKYNLPKVIEKDSEKMYAMVAPDCHAALDKLYADLYRGKSTSCDIRFKNVNSDTPHWERIIYSVVCDDKGMPTIGYGIGMDITQSKLRSIQYKKELEQLHTITQSNIIAKGHYNLSTGKVLEYISSSPHALSTKAGDDYFTFMGNLLYMISLPEDRAKVEKTLDRDYLIKKFIEGERSFTLEYHRQNDYMSPILVEMAISTFTGKNGNIECFITFYDLTSKFMGDIIANKVTDLGYSQMSIVNLMTGTMTYYSRQTGPIESTPEKPLYYELAVKEKIVNMLGEEKTNEIFEFMSLDYITTQLIDREMYDYAFDLPDDEGHLTRKRIQCCYLDNTKTSIFIAQSDITEQYRLESQRLSDLHRAITAAEKANDTKAMFLSGISHDMRTPLNGIVSFTNFALETDDVEKKQDYLMKIQQSSNLLLNLINDTLNLTRIESGKVTVDLENVNFNELLDSITTSIQVAADERNINFIVDVDPALPACFCTDRLKMQEICLNLLSNAVKFTHPKGTILFSFTYLPDTMSENAGRNVPTCRIIVKDNGIGMSQEFLPKLFDAFAQEHSNEIQNPTGTGLGLSIVKRYIEMMGGTVDVESEQGEGTTFTVMMPWEGVEDEKSEVATAAINTLDFSHLSVLLVEDNLLNQEIATMLLEDKGIKVTLATNGREAVDQIALNPPNTFDLILMDIRMPVMTGYEATATIRHMPRDDAKTIPIIAMTADAYQEDIRRCHEVGMQAHVVKPINPMILFSEISRICNI